MKRKDGELGCFDRIERKMVSRVKAMSEIADEIVRHGFEMTGATTEDKWNSLVSTFIQIEDHNEQTGIDRILEREAHSTEKLLIISAKGLRPTTGCGQKCNPVRSPNIRSILSCVARAGPNHDIDGTVPVESRMKSCLLSDPLDLTVLPIGHVGRR